MFFNFNSFSFYLDGFDVKVTGCSTTLLIVVFMRSSFDPGKYSGIPTALLNRSDLNKLTIMSCVDAVVSQYRLKAQGKVIHTGIVRIGMIKMYLLIFRITLDVFVAEEVSIFAKETSPPSTGRIPVGSGALRSLNHQKPSVRMPGLIS